MLHTCMVLFTLTPSHPHRAVCDFIVHRKCESRVNIDCSSKLERAVLQRDQLAEEHATATEEEDCEKERKVGI